MVKAAEFSIEVYALERAEANLVNECLGWLRHFFPLMLQAAEVHLPHTTGMQIVFTERAIPHEVRKVLSGPRRAKGQQKQLPEIRERAS